MRVLTPLLVLALVFGCVRPERLEQSTTEPARDLGAEDGGAAQDGGAAADGGAVDADDPGPKEPTRAEPQDPEARRLAECARRGYNASEAPSEAACAEWAERVGETDCARHRGVLRPMWTAYDDPCNGLPVASCACDRCRDDSDCKRGETCMLVAQPHPASPQVYVCTPRKPCSKPRFWYYSHGEVRCERPPAPPPRGPGR